MTKQKKFITCDGNQVISQCIFLEVAAIYPITRWLST